MTSMLHSTPDNPIPGNHTVGFFEGVGNRKLRYAIFKSDTPVAKGTVVLLQGRNESIEKYAETIGELTARGLWVATYDFRGQGGSARLLRDARSGHVRRFTDYERDLDTFLEQVVLPDTRLPFFLLAHSTGALIALSAAPMLANRVERMVLCSPFVALGGQSASPQTIRLLARLSCLTGFGSRPLKPPGPAHGFAGNPLTGDETRFRRNATIAAEHPELNLGPPTARWLNECFAAIDRVMQPDHLAEIMIPTLVLAPTQDVIVPYAAQERLTRHFRAGQLITVTGSRHELLQERDQ